MGFRSSGQSPGRPSSGRTPTLHLVGPGEVGRRFLQQLAGQPFDVIAVTDSSATVFDRGGIDRDAIAAHKAAGGRLATWRGAEALPTDIAIELVDADVVVDATPSRLADTAAAVSRVRTALRNGAFVALAGKTALAAAAPEILLGRNRGRIGVQATLGGAGAQLLRELDELRADCTALALVSNVTTTVIIGAIEAGASVEEGVAEADALGLLEPDPSLDLDGGDAATKLAAVIGSVFGQPGEASIELAAIQRESVRGLDPELLRERRRRGATTRLVGRASRSGPASVAFEAVPIGSPLAAPPDRVVYTYELPAGVRVHTGLAVGYERTAAALLSDCLAGSKAVRS